LRVESVAGLLRKQLAGLTGREWRADGQGGALRVGTMQRRVAHHQTGGEVGSQCRHDRGVERAGVAGGRLEVLVDGLAPIDTVVLGQDAQQRPQLEPPLFRRQLMASHPSTKQLRSIHYTITNICPSYGQLRTGSLFMKHGVEISWYTYSSWK